MQRKKRFTKGQSVVEGRRAASIAKNPEGTGHLICLVQWIYAGQVSTGKYTRSSERLAVDSVGSWCFGRRGKIECVQPVDRAWSTPVGLDTARSTRGEAIIVAMWPGRSCRRTLPVGTCTHTIFLKPSSCCSTRDRTILVGPRNSLFYTNGGRTVEATIEIIRQTRKTGYQVIDGLRSTIIGEKTGKGTATGIFIPRAIERANAAWISNRDSLVSRRLVVGKDDGCFDDRSNKIY